MEEAPDRTRRGHNHHRRSSRHDYHKRSEKLAHEPSAGASRRHAHGPAQGPVSYLDSWLETQAPATVVIAPQVRVLASGQDKETKQSRQHRHHRRLSHDSSIIAPAEPQHRLLQPAHAPAVYQEAAPVSEHAHGTKRTRLRPPSDESDHRNHREEGGQRYEKRARHKTRDDKYQQNHGGATRRKRVEDEPKHRAERSHEKHLRKKPALATTDDLMHKFTSHAVHHDRLTLKPSAQPGIFGNWKGGKSPGDLTFGDMSFLKEGSRAEPLKTVAKPRRRDPTKSIKEAEDIEVFFSHRKPENSKPNRASTADKETGHRYNSARSNTPNAGHRAQRQSSRTREGSRPTTYFSWSRSRRSSTQPEDRQEQPLEHRQESLPTARPPASSASNPSSPHSSPQKTNSPTPEHIRQSLIESGIYRTLSTFDFREPKKVRQRDEKSSEDDPVEAQENKWHVEDVSDTQAHGSRECLAKQAYVTRRHIPLQSVEEPPRPPDKPRPPGSQAFSAPLSQGESPRQYPFDGSQKRLSISTAPKLVSAVPSSIPCHFQRNAVMAPPPRPPPRLLQRPPSRFKYAIPTIRPQSTHSFTTTDSMPGRPPSALESMEWSSARGPHIPGPVQPAQSLEPAQHEQLLPQLYTSERALSPSLHIEQNDMRQYIESHENIERIMPGSNYENFSTVALSTAGDHQEPYLKPFFRHGASAGSVPSFSIDRSGPAPRMSRSNGPSLRHSSSGTVPQNTGVPSWEPLRRPDEPLENDQDEGRWTTEYDEQVDNDMITYWEPNIYGM